MLEQFPATIVLLLSAKARAASSCDSWLRK
jgi:hypothetical protein